MIEISENESAYIVRSGDRVLSIPKTAPTWVDDPRHSGKGSWSGEKTRITQREVRNELIKRASFLQVPFSELEREVMSFIFRGENND